MKHITLKKTILVSFFLFIALLYGHNLTRDIYSGDIGDLVTASYFFGVPHPPGYPLFTMVGFIFSHLPLPLPIVTKVGLISTIVSVTGLIFYYKFAYRITKNMFLSLLSTSMLAFSYLFWLHAELPEVFGLNNFFVIVIFYMTIVFYQEQKEKNLYLLSFFLGLSLTHHHTILFIFPVVAIIFLRHWKFFFAKKKRIPLTLFFATVGILPYIYVPIAASQNPLINWDHASTFPNFTNLILRKDYGGFAPSVINQVPIAIKLIHVQSYLASILSLYSYQGIALAIFGLIKAFRSSTVLAFALLFGFIFSGPFYAFYGANFVSTTTGLGVIERFYVLPSIVFIFFIPFGFTMLKDFIEPKFSKTIYTYSILGYFLIIPYFMFIYNFPRTNISTTQIGNTFAQDILSSLPTNSVLFVSGDTTTFNIWYIHYVLGQRKDIGLINPAGVGGNKYLDDAINAYHKKHPTMKVSTVLPKTIEDISQRKRVFGTYNMETVPLPKNTMVLPKGLIYELITNDSIPTEEVYLKEIETQWKKLHIKRREALAFSEQNLVTPEIPMFYSNGLVRVGDFLLSYYKNPAKAEHYYRRALWIDPDNPSAYSGLGLSLYKAYKDCKNAPLQLREAIRLYPVWETYYVQLYIIRKQCNARKEELHQIQTEYKNRFNKSIDDNIKRYDI